MDIQEDLVPRLSPRELVAYRSLPWQDVSECSCQDSNNDALCPSLLECTSCRPTGSTCRENVVDKQNGAATQVGIMPDAEGLSHGIHTVRGGLACQAIGGLDPAKRMVNAKIKGMGQALGQCFSLVVASF